MYNADKPKAEDLPTPEKLVKSTVIAAVSAAAILVTVVLPSEYAIDPTGIGRLLGLTEMGEIKNQLAEEAEADQQAAVSPAGGFMSLFVSSAQAQGAPAWQDEFSFTLTPGQGVEWKLAMDKDAEAVFDWSVSEGVVNYDLHGDGGGNSISYEKGRGVPGATGVLKAKFTGSHGWFWRNRTSSDVTVTVRLRGAYSSVKQTY
ncbi:hypothetical protein [Leisingera sp. ANG-Vp]|uniref:hypothetical protein n=1 Tax=Leisingera sp. ANG-Vp TaxID=1577896 RepID=UPI00057FB4E1|nr:hypothetical protein [Leisingera sp. ANG-Vp]KIC18743.1 transmembrane anchor protein [Leisingera sp. ANG-Vp]